MGPGEHRHLAAARYQLRPDVRYRVVRDQAVIIVQGAGEAIVLNQVGTRILELIDRGQDLRSILSVLSEEFAESDETIEADVVDYLDDLVEAGVVEEAAADAPSD